jgi:SAM-dependent methyltransferase
MEESLAADYAAKKEDYFEIPRQEMLHYVPATSKTILDVGCGKGAFGLLLNKRSQCEVWGVEPDSRSIPAAQANLHKAIHGLFSPELALPANYFDAIIFNDVLEHMFDPLSALQYASTLLTARGVIVASIPNIGHFPIIWKLVTRGEWDYKDKGILDKTHLRFFTRDNITKMFTKAGFKLRSIEGINPYVCMEPEDRQIWNRCYRWAKFIPSKGIKDMRYLQFAVVAEKN